MKIIHIIILSIISALAGVLFLAYEQEWIIIRSPFTTTNGLLTASGVSKQNIQFSFWRGHQFKQETRELMIADDAEKKSAQLISNWLTILHEEKILKPKITLQPVYTNSVYASQATPGQAGHSLPAIALKSDGWEARLATPGKAASSYLYVSFDQTPFGTQQSTHEKLMFIEGLKRTLRDNGIKLQGIYFLVNHAEMQDEHLDFSNAWLDC